MEKAEVFNAFFASVVTCKTSTQEPQALETRMEVWSKEDLHSVEENQVREQLNWKCKSMRPDRMHPQVLGKMNRCHCKASLDYLGKVMVKGRGS